MIKLKKLISKTILKPPYVKHSSQTIYQALLGCCKLYEHTLECKWKERAYMLFDILDDIQQQDGGFDIGYEFNFGLLHKKGMSTSPELIGLLAACEFYKLFKEPRAKVVAENAADWILKNYKIIDELSSAIPYSPYNTSEIMVYNGVSFAVGGLGAFIGIFNPIKQEYKNVYDRFISYLDDVTSSSELGRFWYYYDQNRTDIPNGYQHKIDYYHQMQQAEMHSIAQKYCANKKQLILIKDVVEHVNAIQKKHNIVPYTNDKNFFGGNIHLWGYSSVAAGLFEASSLYPDKKDEYIKNAYDVLIWIITYSWNGQYFEPILSHEGDALPSNQYMVRSDAWVFNALASGVKYSKKDNDLFFLEIAEKCFDNMNNCNFSGLETHASNKRTRFVFKLITFLKKLITKH